MSRATVRRSVACGEDDAIHRDAPPFEYAAGAPATRVVQAGPRDGVGIDVGHHEIFLKGPTSGHDAAALIHDEAVAVKDQLVLAPDLVDVGHCHKVVHGAGGQHF